MPGFRAVHLGADLHVVSCQDDARLLCGEGQRHDGFTLQRLSSFINKDVREVTLKIKHELCYGTDYILDTWQNVRIGIDA